MGIERWLERLMAEIPNIDLSVRQININSLGIPDVPKWLTSEPPQAIPIYPPVTSQIGTPTVSYTHLTLPTSDLV